MSNEDFILSQLDTQNERVAELERQLEIAREALEHITLIDCTHIHSYIPEHMVETAREALREMGEK